jgi:cell wall-associated NlpC family hydrolase
MSGDGAALAAAAERLLGTPFRLHGRDPARGLDCVGLVAAALEAIGRPIEAPAGYSLRRLTIEPLMRSAARCGLVEVTGAMRPGDVLLARPGPAQYHLAIAASGGSFVHAHAGLGRVARTPAPLHWPIDRQWRLLAS